MSALPPKADIRSGPARQLRCHAPSQAEPACRGTTSWPKFWSFLSQRSKKRKRHMAHARLGIIAVVLAASVETSAQTQTQTESPGRTLWDHNGSIVYLVANGSSREFYYQKPRPGMLDVGARPGSLLFRGQLNSGQISGTAYFFNLHCGSIPFEVKGASLENEERIVLTGQAPRVGQNCRTYGSYTSNLEFRRSKTDEANQSSEAKAAAPIPEINASRIEIKPAASSTNGGDVPPREPTKQRAPRNETPSKPSDSSATLVVSNEPGAARTSPDASTGAKISGAKDLDRYLWGAALIIMTVWLLIKLFGKTLIGMK